MKNGWIFHSYVSLPEGNEDFFDNFLPFGYD